MITTTTSQLQSNTILIKANKLLVKMQPGCIKTYTRISGFIFSYLCGETN